MKFNHFAGRALPQLHEVCSRKVALEHVVLHWKVMHAELEVHVVLGINLLLDGHCDGAHRHIVRAFEVVFNDSVLRHELR